MEVINFHSATLNSQCIVCGTNSLSNYVDLTLVTSRTSRSNTPVTDKVRSIIGEKWVTSESDITMIMCLQCFQLVDQIDTLEAQLHNVKTQLCDKYFHFHGPPIIDETTYLKLDQRNITQVGNTRPKRAVASKNRLSSNSSGKRKRSVLDSREQNVSVQSTHNVCIQVDSRKDKADAILHWHNTQIHPFDQATGQLPELAVPSQQLTERETEHIITSLNNAVSDSTWRPSENGPNVCLGSSKSQTHQERVAHDPVSEDEIHDAQSDIVYDELPGILVPGERLRVGMLVQGEDGIISYCCCYCGDMFGEHIILSSHVHSHHHPEVLTTQIPPELGLGTKLNCGVQLSNVTVTSDFAKPFMCIFCDGAFKFKSNIHLHFKEKHTPYKPFSCMDCNETFRRSMELSRHRVYYCSFRKKTRTGNDKKSK